MLQAFADAAGKIRADVTDASMQSRPRPAPGSTPHVYATRISVGGSGAGRVDEAARTFLGLTDFLRVNFPATFSEISVLDVHSQPCRIVFVRR